MRSMMRSACVLKTCRSKRKRFILDWRKKSPRAKQSQPHGRRGLAARNAKIRKAGEPLKHRSRKRRRVALPALVAVALLSFPACMSEVLERQAEQIRQQNEEIARQRKEIEALAAGKQIQNRKQQDCNRAFREYFDKAPASTNRA